MSSEIDQLISTLVNGQPAEPSKDDPVAKSPQVISAPEGVIEKYQIPIKVGKGGVPLSETTKPWIIGTFIPKGYLNPKHHDGHPAVDYAAPKGTPIYPIASGKVSEVQEYPKGGKTCKVAHEGGVVISYYAHMMQVNVGVGAEVTQSSVLGLVGNTGSAYDTSPHVHLGVKVNGASVDPQSVMGKEVGSLSPHKKPKVAEEYDQMLAGFVKKPSIKPVPMAKSAQERILNQYLAGHSSFEELKISHPDASVAELAKIARATRY